VIVVIARNGRPCWLANVLPSSPSWFTPGRSCPPLRLFGSLPNSGMMSPFTDARWLLGVRLHSAGIVDAPSEPIGDGGDTSTGP
jgi:hypothetical protein